MQELVKSAHQILSAIHKHRSFPEDAVCALVFEMPFDCPGIACPDCPFYVENTNKIKLGGTPDG